jgi:hypothetical protein
MQRMVTGIIGIVCITILLIASPTGAFHIKTVEEGLLNESGCYVGAYLGGNQGVDGPNYYRTSRQDGSSYETQILDPGIPYGKVNTGIDTFRSAAGAQAVIFSRYADLVTAPYDNDYEKIAFVPSQNMSEWADTVCRKGGVPMIVLDPWAYTDSQGLLSLSVNKGDVNDKTGQPAGNGTQHIIDFARQLGEVSRKNADKNGNATILVVFGQEFESHNEANPPGNKNSNGMHQQAFRKMYREAYTLFHTYANDDVQLVWAGNVADTWQSKQWWWPGFGDTMNTLPSDYVDWVGQTRYHFALNQQLADMEDYYAYYSVAKNHPFIFTETGADGGGNASLQIQLTEDWIPKLYHVPALSGQFGNIKGIVWFNVAKTEENLHKNFLLPDGVWIDNGVNTPGAVRSSSSPLAMMLPLYPDAVRQTYFHSPLSGGPAPGPGVISGRVMSGSDYGPYGVPGARVRVAGRSGDLDNPAKSWENATDNRGIYTITGLPGGMALYATVISPASAPHQYFIRPISYQITTLTCPGEALSSANPVCTGVPDNGAVISCPDSSITPVIPPLGTGEKVQVDWYLVQDPSYFGYEFV